MRQPSERRQLTLASQRRGAAAETGMAEEGRASPPTNAIGGWNRGTPPSCRRGTRRVGDAARVDAAAARAAEAKQKSLELTATARENLSPHLAKLDEATASARTRSPRTRRIRKAALDGLHACPGRGEPYRGG